MKMFRGGGIDFFKKDDRILLYPGKTVLKITLDNPRRTAYDIAFLGGDAEFAVRDECSFDGPSVIKVTLEYPEGGVTEGGRPDIALRLRRQGYAPPADIPLPLECAVRQVPFRYAGMYASPDTLKKIILCFDADIGLSEKNITFEGGTPVSGSLAQIAPGVYEFDAAGITGEPPKVTVDPEGCTVSPQSREVAAGQDGPVRFLGAAPDNDVSGATTGMYLYFDKDLGDLFADDIVIDGPATVAEEPLQKNVFGMAGIYRAALNVTGGGTITVTAGKSGVTVTPPSREVPVNMPVTFTGLEAADGEAGILTTTRLTLTFDKEIKGLDVSDITLDAGVTEAAKISLSGSGLTYTLGISGVTTAGDVTVTVSKDGYLIESASLAAQVHCTASIKAKFNVTETGRTGVAKAFSELHTFIQAGGLANQPNIIKLGDWIDLEGGLAVSPYGGSDGNGGGGFALDPTKAMEKVTKQGQPWGTLCRLIVVGINSFNEKNNNNTPHVVFQFQSIPVMRRMNASDTNEGGYEVSEMRKYLAPVENDSINGNFLKGLIEAGVPDEVLWAPVRILSKSSNGADTVPLSDKLWLPTEREMFRDGKSTYAEGLYSADSETEDNQARLAYYTTDSTRLKVWHERKDRYPNMTNLGSDYWTGSTYSGSSLTFTIVRDTGGNHDAGNGASSVLGVAPAFCVN
jgi:hypothetical protein